MKNGRERPAMRVVGPRESMSKALTSAHLRATWPSTLMLRSEVGLFSWPWASSLANRESTERLEISIFSALLSAHT